MVDFSSLTFSVLIPEHQCRYDPLDYQCSGSYEYEDSMRNKNILMLSNRKRFNNQDYSSDSPIVRESQIRWINFPLLQTKYDFKVQISELTREDNILMAIEDVTAVEEPFFKIVKSNDEVTMLPYNTRIFITI